MPLPRVPDPDEIVIHVHSAKGKLGPVSRRALAAEVAAGSVPSNAHVWMKGMDEWERLAGHRDTLLEGLDEAAQITQVGAAPVMPPRQSTAPASTATNAAAPTSAEPKATESSPDPVSDPAITGASPVVSKEEVASVSASDEEVGNGLHGGMTQVAVPLARPVPNPAAGPEPLAVAEESHDATDEAETAEVPTARMSRDAIATAQAATAPTPQPVEPAAAVEPADPDEAGIIAVTSVLAADDDDAKDKVFVDLVKGSWRYLSEHRYAAHIDEVFVGAVITSTLDVGYSLIDLSSDGTNHYLRFENLKDRTRIILRLTHLTGSLALSRVLGQRVSAVIGYGERVPSFTKIWGAVQAEMKSSYIKDPEPGTITVDGDVNSGYVYCQVDLYLDIEEYVNRDYVVDHARLSRHIGSTTHALRKYLRGRFA